MKITEEEKQTVLAALKSHPHFTTDATPYADLLLKTGFRSGKLNALKAALVAEGKIWEDEDEESGRRVIYLVVPDKRQQIIDLIKRWVLEKPFTFPVGTRDFAIYCRIPSDHVHEIFLRLANEGILTIAYMQVDPSPQWEAAVLAETTAK